MKRIIFIFAAILVATSMAFAQKKAVISVEESAFDFGVIKEANGKRHAPGHHTGHRLMWLHDAPMAQATHSPKGESGNQGHFRSSGTPWRVCQDHLRLQ